MLGTDAAASEDHTSAPAVTSADCERNSLRVVIGIGLCLAPAAKGRSSFSSCSEADYSRMWATYS